MRTLGFVLLTAAMAAGQGLPQLSNFNADLKAHLGLSSEQVARIQANNKELADQTSNQFSRFSRQFFEINFELAKPAPDPMIVGARYAEIEKVCREDARLATRTRDQNLALLTDAQKVKLKALEEAARMTSVVEEAQSANLYRAVPTQSLASFLLGGGALIGGGGALAIPGLGSSLVAAAPGCGRVGPVSRCPADRPVRSPDEP